MADVQCRYCHAMNDAEERRCARCGRRLHLSDPRPAPEVYPIASPAASMTATAVAPAFESIPGGAPTPAPEAEQTPAERASYQPSLFPAGAPGVSKVIPIPTLTPLRSDLPELPRPRRVASSTSASRARRDSDSQRALEFQDPDRQGLAMDVDVIYCDAPVAVPAHRLIAAAVDTSVILLALGLFLGVFYLGGGDVVLNRQTIPYVVGVALVIGMFYRIVWVLADSDTPGMRFAGLTLVNFDGREPNREQRGVRQIAGLLSIFSAGLGLLWALVDEESLTWHDHISKTFPTPSL